MTDSDDAIEKVDLLALVLAFFMVRLAARSWAMLPPANLPAAILVIATIATTLAAVALASSSLNPSHYITSLSVAAGACVVGSGTLLYWRFGGPLPRNPGTVVVVLAGFGVAAAAAYAAARQDVDIRPYMPVFGWVAAAVIVAASLLIWASVDRPHIGTDVMLFSQQAAEYLLTGNNPYTHSLLPGLNAVGLDLKPWQRSAFVTPRTDGGTAHRLVYPAGAVLVVVPQLLLTETPQPLLTYMLPAIGIVLLLVRVSPPVLAPLGVVAAIGPRNIVMGAMGGLSDPLWVLPVLVAMVYWDQHQWLAAGLAFGVAASMKQQPWLMAPFLGYWLLATHDSWRQRLAAETRFWGGVATTFGAVNVPFIMWNAQAWVTGVLRPLRDGAAPLVTQGLGLALLTSSGAYPLPKDTYLLLVVGWGATLGCLYILFFERVKWIAWLAPGLVLFANYRSLPSYFYFVMPVAYMAVLGRAGIMYQPRRLWRPRSWLPGGSDAPA